jgi:AbrB family looped-hinge helix DNA binding protein
MSEAAVTSKGQITIPAEVRKAMHIAPGDRVVFTVLADGTTVFRAKVRSLRSLVGSFRPKRRRAVAAEQMRIGRK